MKVFKRIIIASVLLLSITQCYYDNKDDLYEDYIPCSVDTTIAITYSMDISPLLTTNCARAGCHNSSARQSGLDLSSYADVEIIASDGRLENRINGIGPIMPPSGSMRLCDIERIEIWIKEGALNN